MATTSPTPPDRERGVPRTIRMDTEIWTPFLALCREVERTSGSSVLRQWIQEWLESYGVFMAPEVAEIDPERKPVPWFECETHQCAHRLSGLGVPWGCSPAKSRADRLERQRREGRSQR